MKELSIHKSQLTKVLQDVEVLVEDVASLVDDDIKARKRMSDIEMNPSIGKSEEELDSYLKKRGVRIE